MIISWDYLNLSQWPMLLQADQPIRLQYLHPILNILG